MLDDMLDNLMLYLTVPESNKMTLRYQLTSEEYIEFCHGNRWEALL